MTTPSVTPIVPRQGQCELLQRLVETACRASNWGPNLADPSERLRAALASHSFSFDAHGVALRAWVTSELQLAMAVSRVVTWNADIERAVQLQLAHSPSLIAGLLLHHWGVVRIAVVEWLDDD
jgi:hypothetical protein